MYQTLSSDIVFPSFHKHGILLNLFKYQYQCILSTDSLSSFRLMAKDPPVLKIRKPNRVQEVQAILGWKPRADGTEQEGKSTTRVGRCLRTKMQSPEAQDDNPAWPHSGTQRFRGVGGDEARKQRNRDREIETKEGEGEGGKWRWWHGGWCLLSPGAKADQFWNKTFSQSISYSNWIIYQMKFHINNRQLAERAYGPKMI
jgi:hypothetical protein